MFGEAEIATLKAMKNPSKATFQDRFRLIYAYYGFINQLRFAKILTIRKIFHSHFVNSIHKFESGNAISLYR